MTLARKSDTRGLCILTAASDLRTRNSLFWKTQKRVPHRTPELQQLGLWSLGRSPQQGGEQPYTARTDAPDARGTPLCLATPKSHNHCGYIGRTKSLMLRRRWLSQPRFASKSSAPSQHKRLLMNPADSRYLTSSPTSRYFPRKNSSGSPSRTTTSSTWAMKMV